MADSQAQQRASITRPASTIASIENNVAELIAEDMKDLDHPDDTDTTNNNSMPQNGIFSIATDTHDTERKPWRQRLGEPDNTQQLTKENINRHENISENGTRPSRERIGLNKDAQEVRTIPKTDWLESHEIKRQPTRRSWRDRLEMHGDEREPRETLGSPENDLDTSATRTSWRDRLRMQEDNSDTVTKSKDRLEYNEETSHRTRTSWRDRLGMQEDNSETFTKSNDRLEHNEDTSHRSRTSWRDRLGMQEDNSETFTKSKDRLDHNEDTSYRTRNSWRDRLGMQEENDETLTKSRRNRSASSENIHETGARPCLKRLGSLDYTSATTSRPWRERLDMNKDESGTKYRPWRERIGMQEESNTSVRRPWRERLSTQEDTNDTVRTSWRDRLGMQEERHDTEPELPRDQITSRRHASERKGIESLQEASVEQETARVPEMAAVENASVARSASMEDVEQSNQQDENTNDLDDEDNVETNQNHEAEHDSVQAKEIDDNGEIQEKSWTSEDVLKLLIKAINYRSPMKDIQTVLKWGLDVNTPFKNGLCALHYAAYTNYVNCVEILLKNGANINVTDEIGYTPLHLAARCGHYKIMEKLIDNGAMITFNEPGVEIKGIDRQNKLGFTNTEPVNLAIQNCHPECAELLLQNGARADNKYFMGYEISLAPLDDIRGLEVLLQHGASPNVFNRCGSSPLMKACKDHHIDAVRLLLKHGADYNAQCPPMFEQKSVLQIAIQSGNIVIINLILAKNPKLSRNDNYKYSALHTAVIKGRSDVCRLLLQRGANAEEQTDEGATPLMIACSTEGVTERKDIVQMLLDCGANVNAYGQNFSYLDPYLSPLTEYLKIIGNSESFNIIECLISHGARIHYTSGDILLGGRRDPYAILPYAHSMSNFPDIFDLTMQAAQRYNPLAIHVCDNLPEDMKNTLLLVATKPQDLKHTVRLSIRHILMPGITDKLTQLPLPELLKSYLIFK